jgi:hypothetical protein
MNEMIECYTYHSHYLRILNAAGLVKVEQKGTERAVIYICLIMQSNCLSISFTLHIIRSNRSIGLCVYSYIKDSTYECIHIREDHFIHTLSLKSC